MNDSCKTHQKITKNIKKYKVNAFSETSESTNHLPKIVLWDLSDYLIKLTALKQKLSPYSETVSSETEIAFIQKTHNFKWVKKENGTFKYN